MSSLEGQQLQKRLFTEIAFLSLVVIAALLPFTQTLFHGASISKVDLIKNFDAVQAQSLRSPFWLSDDLSASMAHVPNELFAAKHEGSAELPLWNHLNGAGRPFVGEFQTLRFSILHSLFPATSSQLYNLGILTKILLAGIGAFILSRYVGLTRWAAFAAAVAFAFCPHSLRFVELCDNYFFYPFFLLSFLCLAAKPSMLRASLTALLCGFGAYNMHPETFACGTIFSAIAGLLSFIWKSTASNDASEIKATPTNLRRLLPAVGWVGLVAVLTFLLSAPLVLTLAEFIANGESYKFADYKIDHIQALSVFTDLFLPGTAGSSYMGIALGLSALAGMFVWARKNLALLFTFAVVFLFTTRPGFLDPLLATAPLSFLLPEYSSYFMFILLALASATGLQSLVLGENLSREWRNLALSISVLSASFMLLGNLSASSNFVSRWLEFTPAELKFSSAFIPLSLALTLLFPISILLARSDAKLRTISLAVFSLANSALLLYLAPLELGVHESFEF
ncbi:MAG: hypothetical protein K2X81_13995, partial [Candidatus Obscuribacterales bacterium]|nr:hypothetical protein [Candidatus Obscuribacterales bacterium]